MLIKRVLLLLAIAFPTPAFSQNDWDVMTTFYAWFPGASTTVEIPLGEIEADADFGDIVDSLDMAFFGAIDARNGRWSLTADLLFADLETEDASPLGGMFSLVKVESRVTMLSAYTSYAVIDGPNTRFELGSGARYTDAAIETRLVGLSDTPSASYTDDGGWVDLVIAARLHRNYGPKLYGVAFGEVGGFGIGDSADLTWQAFGGVGYRINDRWSVLGGYRELSIEREFGPTDVDAKLSGPVLGLQTPF
ncbi:hypothetical protein [Parvularcula bermudensis]|nr:hypothetical protein [Parvularcula bermudensis]